MPKQNQYLQGKCLNLKIIYGLSRSTSQRSLVNCKLAKHNSTNIVWTLKISFFRRIQFWEKQRLPFNKSSSGYSCTHSVNSPLSKATFYWLDTLKGGELVEDGRGLRLRQTDRQTVDGHFFTPRGLTAFVYFSLLYKSLLFNLEVRPDVTSFNHILAGTAD